MPRQTARAACARTAAPTARATAPGGGPDRGRLHRRSHGRHRLPPGNEGDAGRDHDFRPTTLMERVSRHVEAHPREFTRDALTKEVTGKNTYLRMAVDVLTEEGS